MRHVEAYPEPPPLEASGVPLGTLGGDLAKGAGQKCGWMELPKIKCIFGKATLELLDFISSLDLFPFSRMLSD